MAFLDNENGWIILSENTSKENTREEVNQYHDLIRDFVLDQIPQQADLLISADSDYVIWLNGKQIGSGQYRTHPHDRVYESFPISTFLQQGPNHLAILWYYIGESSSTYSTGIPCLKFEIQIDNKLINHSTPLIRQSHTYVSGRMEKTSPQLFFTARYDARAEDDWQSPGYSPGPEWEPARTTAIKNCSVRQRPILRCSLEGALAANLIAQGSFYDRQPIEDSPAKRIQTAFLSACRLDELTDGSFPLSFKAPTVDPDVLSSDGIYLIVDLGKEDTGHISLDIDAPEGTEVDIGFGEHLDDMRVRSWVGGRHFGVRYTCGKGRRSWTDMFRRCGLRYIQLHVHSNIFVLYSLTILPVHYPVKPLEAPELKDKMHQAIDRISLRTLKLCMHEHYEDCPWREQALYTMDARNQMLFGFYCFDNASFARSNIVLMAEGARPDGLLELCFPARVPITIPSFSLVFPILLDEYVTHTGDIDAARTFLPRASSILEVFIERREHNGLVPAFPETPYWNFYEWSEGMDGGNIFRTDTLESSIDAPLNAFLSASLKSCSKLCEACGKDEQAEYYINMHKEINAALHDIFFDPSRGIYASFLRNGRVVHYAELTQSLMFFCGAVPEDNRISVLEDLASGRNGSVPITLSHSVFKYDALMLYPERFGQHVISEVEKRWGNMIRKGATTCWETDRGAQDFDFGGSLCHGWSAVPAYLYRKYFKGII